VPIWLSLSVRRHNVGVRPSWSGYEQISNDDGLAARTWWDVTAADYLREHGSFLGKRDLRWCPEGLLEDDVQLLGDLTGLRVLVVGCGAAQGARWAFDVGADVVGIDVSVSMLIADDADVPLICADARALPFVANSFDVAFSAFGAIPFVPDPHTVHSEVARVLRPGGRWVFAIPHPFRWCFLDDPTEAGLTAHRSYFDERPYVETDASGTPVYAEYHYTLGAHLRAVVTAGFIVTDLVEPTWQAGDAVWGGWGPVRGEFLPGTAIFVTQLP
jgi:SAM-dependent methyltransferase